MARKFMHLEKILSTDPHTKNPVGFKIAGHINTEDIEIGKKLPISLQDSFFRLSPLVNITEDVIVTENATYRYRYVDVGGDSGTEDYPLENYFVPTITMDPDATNFADLIGFTKLDTHLLATKVAYARHKKENDPIQGTALILPLLTEKEIIILIGAAMAAIAKKNH